MSSTARLYYGFEVDRESFIKFMIPSSEFTGSIHGIISTREYSFVFGYKLGDVRTGEPVEVVDIPVDLKEEIYYRMKAFCSEHELPFTEPKILLVNICHHE